MTVVNHTANQIWLQIVKNQHKINRLLVILLAIYLLAYAADLTWRLVPVSSSSDSATITHTTGSLNKANNPDQNLNLADIKRLNLFGDLAAPPKVEEVAVIDAPVTRLNLTLTGVVSSTDKESGAAIIENRNQQQTYGIGEKIEGTNATLKEVYADRVIIKNGPTNETLMLDGVDYNKPSSQALARPSNSAKKPEINEGPQRLVLTDEALEAGRELQVQPSSFVDYIAVAPHRPEGELTGYRVSPGRKPTLFKSAGLQAGDVITEINGLDLTDTQQALEAMNLLKELQSLQMSVERQNQLITIYLELPQGEEEPEA
ncbi:type II secretion system protein GspC [Paraglaciecola aestuariivivens]